MQSKTKVSLPYAVLVSLALAACGSANDPAVNAIDERDLDVSTQELAIDSDTLWRPAWTGRTFIPVCFTNGTTAQRNNVRNVAETSWEAIGSTTTGLNGRYGVDFQGFGTCAASTPETVRVTFNTTNLNQVHGGLGRTMDGMDLDTSATNATIMHEFGHALGFTHEFLRSDYSATDPACTATGGTVPDLGISGADTASIMNYVACGRTGTLTLADVVSYAELYGPMTLTYGSKMAIRHENTWRYVRGDSTPDVSSGSIAASQEFTFEFVSGVSSSSVSFGDAVRIKTNDNKYLLSNGPGAFITTTTSAASATQWRIRGRISGDVVRVNDEVLFAAPSSAFHVIQADASNRLVIGSGHFFQIAQLLGAINL